MKQRGFKLEFGPKVTLAVIQQQRYYLSYFLSNAAGASYARAKDSSLFTVRAQDLSIRTALN